MRRSARNVELLSARLKDLGYQFINPTEVHRTLNAKEGKLVERAERSGLWLPLSVRAWPQEVGQLNLNGSHPALCFMDTERGKPGIYTDPAGPTCIDADPEEKESGSQWNALPA